MADKLELVRGYDFVADQGTVSLLNYTDGFEVAYQGWAPQTVPDRDGLITDAITLRARGTSVNDLAASIQKLAEKEQNVRDFYDLRGEKTGVWLRVQHEGETQVRQAYIAEMTHRMDSSIYDEALRQQSHVNQLTLAVRRQPYWEAVTPGTVSAARVPCMGGTFALGTSVAGDIPARIARLTVGENVLYMSPGDPVFPSYQIWLGFRTNRFGVAASFVPFWGFGSALYPWRRVDPFGGGTIMGGYVYGGGSWVVDADTVYGRRLEYYQPSGGTLPQNAFVGGVSTWAVTEAYNEQAGEYLAVLRARVSNAGTYLVQLVSSNAYDSLFWTGIAYPNGNIHRTFPNGLILPRVPVTNASGTSDTFWRTIDLGRVTIPGNTNLERLLPNIRNQSLNLYCERLGGDGTLFVDGIYLIPTEGLTVISSPYDQDTKNLIDQPPHTLIASETPDRRQQATLMGELNATAYGLGTIDVYMAAGVPYFERGVPTGSDAIGVLLAAPKIPDTDATHGVLGNELDVNIEYIARWVDMRGGDG